MTDKNRSALGPRVGRGLLACALATTLGLGIVGCEQSTTGDDSSSQATEQQSSAALGAPSDLSIDFASGDFTFQSNDEGVGYYFLRVYNQGGSAAGEEYIASSSRINGGSAGELSGSVDLSVLAWDAYDFNLVGYAAAGSDAEAPEPQTFTYQLGVGGVMERPEMMVLADGNQAEFYIDLFTLSDWYKMQRMPEVRFDVYSDAECTQSVTSETVDLGDMAPQAAAGPWASGTNWATDAEALHKYLQPPEGGGQQMGPMAAPTEPVGLVSQLVVEGLEPGTYYVTATALGTEDGKISDSQTSEAVEFSVTADEPTGEFTATKTSMWADPQLGAMGASATEGTYPDRVDFAQGQTTSGELVSS